jgi:hypothetical protein
VSRNAVPLATTAPRLHSLARRPGGLAWPTPKSMAHRATASCELSRPEPKNDV